MLIGLSTVILKGLEFEGIIIDFELSFHPNNGHCHCAKIVKVEAVGLDLEILNMFHLSSIKVFLR